MYYRYLIVILFFASCGQHEDGPVRGDLDSVPVAAGSIFPYQACATAYDTACLPAPGSKVTPAQIVIFASSLLGTRYSFGCTAPSTGFDCSGFINYVFDHFHITVPRSSVDFTNVGTTIALKACMPGDLILFTGTDSHQRTVGHIGIITVNDEDGISFIHASSGKEMAVIVTRLDDRYMARFVKVVRII